MSRINNIMKNIQNIKTTIAGVVGIIIAVIMFYETRDLLYTSAIITTSLGLLASKDANTE